MKYLYVKVYVGKPDPKGAALLNSLLEKSTGKAAPDLVPHATPDRTRFLHTFVEAEDDHEAYLLGSRKLPPPHGGEVVNDYVVNLAQQ